MNISRVLNIADVQRYLGQKIRVGGFVASIRDQKMMQFLVLRDDTGKVQIVHEKNTNNNLTEKISELTRESYIEIIGTVTENPDVKIGGFEIVAENIFTHSTAESPLPIGKKSSPENRLNWRFIDLRKPENHLIFRIQTAMEKAMRDFWENFGFIEIHSPKMMSTPSESGAELFQVKYFNKGMASLAQSPQFYKQMAIAAGFRWVFEIGPVFRANPSFTTRHDTEFTSIDVEFEGVSSHEDVMHLEERWLHYVINKLEEQFGHVVKKHFDVEIVVPEVPFPRITLNEAMDLLENNGHFIEHRADLDPEGEKRLHSLIKKQTGHDFVFVTDYPIETRPFYHMRHPNNPKLTRSFDLLWKGLEVTTGAQREHRYEILKKQAISKDLDIKPLEDYLNFFRYGCPPHGGFGVGLTRLLMVLLERPNVREVTFLYRGPNRLTP